jgi:hypothetical protein
MNTNGMARIFIKLYIHVKPKISVYTLFTLTVTLDRVKPSIILCVIIRLVVKWKDIFSRVIRAISNLSDKRCLI